MASVGSSIWAIDIGGSSLKALRLTDVNGVVEVIDFDNIKHDKILSGKDVKDLEREELIAISLRQFVQKHDLEKSDIIISLPSQNSFARFITLPPVEPKRIPEIIRFEAVQQIPFDINDVQWDWQLMEGESSEENRVGIFAIKSEVITSMLAHFSREDIQVRFIQMAPMALYNYALYDRADLSKSGRQSVVILNIGAEYSDLVVCTRTSVWQRCIPMGGNSFTKAISDAFKINFEKAEKLKRNATMSKYARQILQAMKPVFADLASEIQRSIGFYKSSNPETKLVKIVAMGGGTRMRGLVKYLQQSLQMPIERTDSFEKLSMGPDVSAASFHENVCEFGVVYGLGLQALGLGRIESNLLPRHIARSMSWASKAKYFAAAASLLLVVSVLAFGRVLFDKASYRGKQRSRDRVADIVRNAELANNMLQEQEQRQPGTQSIMEKYLGLFRYREVVPELMQTIILALPNERNTSEQEQRQLYRAFAAGNVEEVKKIDRKERKQIFITNMSIRFESDISTEEFAAAEQRRRVSTTRPASTVERQMSQQEFYQKYQEELKRRAEEAQRIKEMADRAFEAEERGEEIEQEQVESRAGFLVTITGYSPYKDIEELMDPFEAGDDRDRWGFITRLKNLDVVVDGNSPFRLFERANPRHFSLDTQPIDLESDVDTPPVGIGIESERRIETKLDAAGRVVTFSGQPDQTQRFITERILIDPMTKEVISKLARYNEDGTPMINEAGRIAYETNDYWFVLRAKLLWLDAPKEIATLTAGK